MLVLISCLVAAYTMEDKRYIKPEVNSNCSEQQCFILDDYIDYFTTESVFIFMAGNHTLNERVTLSNIRNAALRGSEDGNSRIFVHGSINFQSTVNLAIESLTFIFASGDQQEQYLTLTYATTIHIAKCTFKTASSDFRSGVLYIQRSNVFIQNCHFKGNGGGLYGGALHALDQSMIVLNQSTFEDNSVQDSGGALHANQSTLVLCGNTFKQNSAQRNGGAISATNGSVIVIKNCSRKNIFVNNSAENGGAVYTHLSLLEVKTMRVLFKGNRAKYGGALHFQQSNSNLTGDFWGNVAGKCGGAIFSQHHYEDIITVNITNVNITMNANSAMCFHKSSVDFSGTNVIQANQGVLGAGIYSYQGRLTFRGSNMFTNNIASEGGGSIHAKSVIVTLRGHMNFISNSAENGAALYMQCKSALMLGNGSNLTTAGNQAEKCGGIIYYDDKCTGEILDIAETKSVCSLQLDNATFHSEADTAGRMGSFLYGGIDAKGIQQINSCTKISKLPNKAENATLFKPHIKCLCFCERGHNNCSETKEIRLYNGQMLNLSLVVIDDNNESTSASLTAEFRYNGKALSEKPQILPNHCSIVTYNMEQVIHKMEPYANMTLLLHAYDLCNSHKAKATTIDLTIDCPNGFSNELGECMCEPTLNKFNATCELRENEVVIKKESKSLWLGIINENYSANNSRLVLYNYCPFNYCKENVSLSIPYNKWLNPDSLQKGMLCNTYQVTHYADQCNFHRTGVICGACTDNHSLLLGSYRCEKCPNIYLVLLIPFAAAGVVLVLFLSALRLTVASGMINSIIFYANIVQVNRHLVFLSEETNPLTVFIAWVNLDLGFETCFYNGMTAYAQTWLQFLFPIYVWTIIAFIILLSRRSTVLSKLMGDSPISILATLLLMSYSKITHIMMTVLLLAKLKCPNNETQLVWLIDGNISFCTLDYVILLTFTTLMFILLYLPFTFLLLFGYKILRFSNKRCFRWLNRIKPLLDSYYAPYKPHTRFWTGFLLLVRVLMYIPAAYNSYTITSSTIIAALSVMFLVAWLSGGIYTKKIVNFIEASVCMNLVLLFVMAHAFADKLMLEKISYKILVYILVGTVMATMLGIILYHILQVTCGSLLWRGVRAKMPACLRILHMKSFKRRLSSKRKGKDASTTVIKLREPLLETHM